MPSQSSQIVVAPRSIMFSHDGAERWNKQVVGEVGVAGIAQHGQQISGGEEAGAQVCVGGADQFDQTRGRGIPQLVRE